MWLRRGPGCRRPSNPWAVGPSSPHRPAPPCRVGPQSPVSWHSLPHSSERASECNEAPGTTSGARYWGPRSAMEAMNQSGQPRNSGKRGPMWPAPLTSGGLALEEVTCRGWGPHLQHSFLIKKEAPMHALLPLSLLKIILIQIYRLIFAEAVAEVLETQNASGFIFHFSCKQKHDKR